MHACILMHESYVPERVDKETWRWILKWANSKAKKKDRILCITVKRVELRGFEQSHRGTEKLFKIRGFYVLENINT